MPYSCIAEKQQLQFDKRKKVACCSMLMYALISVYVLVNRHYVRWFTNCKEYHDHEYGMTCNCTSRLNVVKETIDSDAVIMIA